MTYNRALVEHLMPAVWDTQAAYGMPQQVEVDVEMRSFRSKPNPKTGNNLPAYLADIRRAWKKAPLSNDECRALFTRYCLGLTDREAGRLLDVPHRTVSYRAESGVGRITAWLNGDEYSPDYDNDSEEVAQL